jgi:hypothetical protein
MSEFHLVIGNKNYSSWSLRAWILMTHLGVKFRETILPLDTAQFKDEIARYSPTGRVPVLLDGELAIWDSLAICEYIAEVTGRGWPVDRAARAVARSVCAEMHSGFANLRAEWPLLPKRDLQSLQISSMPCTLQWYFVSTPTARRSPRPPAGTSPPASKILFCRNGYSPPRARHGPSRDTKWVW